MVAAGGSHFQTCIGSGRDSRDPPLWFREPTIPTREERRQEGHHPIMGARIHQVFSDAFSTQHSIGRSNKTREDTIESLTNVLQAWDVGSGTKILPNLPRVPAYLTKRVCWSGVKKESRHKDLLACMCSMDSQFALVVPDRDG